MISIGDVYRMPTGEGLKIEEYDYPNGKFKAQIRDLKGEWTELRIQGDAIKLPMYLKVEKAVKE